MIGAIQAVVEYVRGINLLVEQMEEYGLHFGIFDPFVESDWKKVWSDFQQRLEANEILKGAVLKAKNSGVGLFLSKTQNVDVKNRTARFDPRKSDDEIILFLLGDEH
jgi:hypothetical protein